MEPDYSSYTKQELIEAYNAIDRDAYPQRFEQIKKHLGMAQIEHDALPEELGDIIPETIEGRFQNKVLLATILMVLFFLLGLWGTNEYFIEGQWTEARQLSFPAMLLIGPWLFLHSRRRWQKHQNDWLRLDGKGISYFELGSLQKILWGELKSVSFVTKRKSVQYIFESAQEVSFSPYISHFGLDATQVESFIRLKAQKYGFKFEKIGLMGISWDKTQ